MDCSGKIYHANAFGHSRKCECQQAVHVNFGTVALLLNKFQISEFGKFIAETVEAGMAVEDPDHRCFCIPTSDHCLMIAMTYNELKALSELLDETLLMVEIEEVLER